LTTASPLRPNDLIAVVAPGSAPASTEQLEAGIARLRARGYRVETARSAFDPTGYLCGSDEDRLAEFNGFLRRPDVAALFCARGGYGSLRLLPHIDYEAALRHPKLVVGYSDITALHLALYHRSGLAGLSGPMVAVEWGDLDPASEKLFWDLASGATPEPLLGPAGEHLQPVRAGSAEGTLLGGNLSVLNRLIGTPYLPPLDGKLLFLEEVGEEPYRLDGLFAQLRLTGILDGLGGLILGGFTEWEPAHDRPSRTLDEVFDDYLADLPYPVARGLVYGHFPVKNSVPVGVAARLEVSSQAASLVILDPVVG
jgi:muramoyltetrapeptide carboxypeptidase